MRSAITISLVPEARGGPFVFWDDLAAGCAAAAALGFDAVEIFAPSASSVDVEQLRVLLTRHSLKVAAFGTGGGWVIQRWHLLHADPAIRQSARAFIRSIIDLGAQFGAPAIIGSMQGRVEGSISREQALGWLGEALNELGERAAQQGVPLFFEPLNRYETNLFNRLGDAARFLDGLPTRNVRILADFFHMNIEEASIPKSIRAAGRLIGHVHFADSNRMAIGFGHTAIEPVIAALQEVGYDGYLSGEILPLPDSQGAAAQTIKAINQVLGQAIPPMLKHQLIHPKINEVLGRGGHHSAILIADGNYPAWSKRGPNAELVCLNLSPGLLSVVQVLRAILTAVPIDHIHTMGIPPDDFYAQSGEPPVWSEFRAALAEAGLPLELEPIQKWDFYKVVESPDHLLTIQTGDQALWGNVLLRMGCRTA